MATGSHSRRLTLAGIFTALCVIGSYIKLGPLSTAFDSAPGFLAALLLGPVPGAAVCFIGHLTVATLTGFPYGPGFHLLTALAMAGVGALGGFMARRAGPWAAGAAMVVANGVLAPALLSFVPNPLGRGLFAFLLLPLTVAAAANALVAVLAAKVLKRRGFTA
ncbi:MAG TPA: ECF transporter S component [Symbiobacteriaceae bacterium]|nr:ECF transporter S component [Symbiobacteriaceae bacterium]